MRELMYQVYYIRHQILFYLWLVRTNIKHGKTPNIITKIVVILKNTINHFWQTTTKNG